MSENTVDLTRARQFLRDLLTSRLSAAEAQWLADKHQLLTNNPEPGDFHLTFSAVSRFIERKALPASPEQQLEADRICAGWRPFQWTADRACRVYFLCLAIPTELRAGLDFIMDVFDTADMREQVAIFSALPVLPHPQAFAKLASEGIRTNMVPVFDAVALDNPYPKVYFEAAAWNQLFLKAAFMGRPLYRIQGVAERANAELSRMVLDYVHERWSAGRDVSPEIWRPTKGFLSAEHRQALQRLAENGNEIQRAAAALTQAEKETIELAGQQWNWERIGKAWEQIHAS